VATAENWRLNRSNPVTFKITDGRGSNAWDGYRGGYRTTMAVAWLIGIGNGRWIARYRGKASRPMKLNAAKKYALEIVKGIRPSEVIADPILHLNLLAAREPLLPRPPTMDIMGGNLRGKLDRKMREEILAVEVSQCIQQAPQPDSVSVAQPLHGDNYPVEYYEDGYPQIPDCLRR
jgi:hypothetical protein